MQLLGTSYPSEGKFSIIDATNDGSLIQKGYTNLDVLTEVRLIINLSGEMPDIEIVDSMRIGFSGITADAKITIIASGTTR